MRVYKMYALIVLVAFTRLVSVAQYFPDNNVILNYNQVMFEYPQVNTAFYYKIQVAFNKTGNAEKDFQNHLFGVYTDSSSACMISDLEFGKKYFWKVTAYNFKNQPVFKSPAINFALMVNEYGDSSLFRHKQYYTKKGRYKEGLIWCDTYHCAIDRAGNVVWLFPVINRNFETPSAMRDLRLHNDGTISFINDSNVFLINRDLTVLWNGPKNEMVTGLKNQCFHHAFNVVSQNNFYAMGTTYKKLFDQAGLKDTMDNYLVNDYIVQYDSLGKIYWLWEYGRNLFDPSLLKNMSSEKRKLYMHPHMNAMSVDSGETFVYVSLRNLSQILKIEKATGKIAAQYGRDFFTKDSLSGGLFNYQHDIKYTGNNRLTLFNNSSEATFKNEKKKPVCQSSVQLLHLPAGENDSLKILWEFFTNFDSLSDHCSTRLGSVDRINGNYLVCAGENARLFEVTENKEVVWDMTLYKKVKTADVFEKLPQYRIMYTSSLYPYYFTFRQNKINNSITVYNEGTNEDDYEVELRGKNNSVLFSQKIFNVKSGAHQTVFLKNSLKKRVSVSVKSSNSQAIKKAK